MTDLVAKQFAFDVEGPLDLVWEALTTPNGLATWYVISAEVDPTPGGALDLDWGTGSVAMGTFDVVEAPTRIKLEYSDPQVGAEEWLLSHEDGVTHVRLIHTLPVEDGSTWDDHYGDITRGWALFHATLVWAAAKRGRMGRRSEVRTGRMTPGGWERVLSALGLDAMPRQGSTVQVLGRDADVIRAFDGYSVLLGWDDAATLLVDVEGDSLYTLGATYGEPSDRMAALQHDILHLAEVLCAAAEGAS